MYAVYSYYRVWLTRLSHTACIYRMHLVHTIVIASRDGVHFHQFFQHAFRAVSGDRLPRLKAYATRCSAIAPKLKKVT